MKKIIWLSSFPKSGNTWVRHLLSNYFFNNQKNFDFNIDKKIARIRIKKNLRTEIDKNNIIKSINSSFHHWLRSQKELKIEGNFCFLKNHNANVNFNNSFFTDESCTLAIVYIVRDPRDVVISASHYWDQSIDWTIDKICQDQYFTGYNPNDLTDYEFFSTWQNNLISWTRADNIKNIPKIIIRYEDLILDIEKEFYRLLSFINKFTGEEVNWEQLKFSIKSSSFETLSKHEEKNKKKFFKKGKKNQWKNKLSDEQILKIEKNLKNGMLSLNYL